MAKGGHIVTKVIIMVCCGLLVVHNAFNIYNICSVKGQDFGNWVVILQLILYVIGLVLCALAFWGALVENAFLVGIAFNICIFFMALLILDLVLCFFNTNGKCNLEFYITFGFGLAILIVLAIAIHMFVESIE